MPSQQPGRSSPVRTSLWRPHQVFFGAARARKKQCLAFKLDPLQGFAKRAAFLCPSPPELCEASLPLLLVFDDGGKRSALSQSNGPNPRASGGDNAELLAREQVVGASDAASRSAGQKNHAPSLRCAAIQLCLHELPQGFICTARMASRRPVVFSRTMRIRYVSTPYFSFVSFAGGCGCQPCNQKGGPRRWTADASLRSPFLFTNGTRFDHIHLSADGRWYLPCRPVLVAAPREVKPHGLSSAGDTGTFPVSLSRLLLRDSAAFWVVNAYIGWDRKHYQGGWKRGKGTFRSTVAVEWTNSEWRMPHLRALLRRSRCAGGPSGGRKYATIFVKLLEFSGSGIAGTLPYPVSLGCR